MMGNMDCSVWGRYREAGYQRYMSAYQSTITVLEVNES